MTQRALRDDLKLVVDNIDSTDAALLAIQSDLQGTYHSTCAIPSTPQCISIANTVLQIQNTRALLLEKTDRIRSLYNGLANVAQKGSELHEKLIRTDIRLQNMQALIGNYIFEIIKYPGKYLKHPDCYRDPGSGQDPVSQCFHPDEQPLHRNGK